MDFDYDFSNPVAMIKQGIANLAEATRTAYQDRLDLLSRFEKAAAWQGESWTYWDFETAPKERQALEAQRLSKRQIDQRCEDLLAEDAATKTPFMRLIETGPAEGMLDRVRALVQAGENPNSATLLKDTPLGYARYHGYMDVFDLLIQLGADGERAGFSKLHHAVRYGTLAEVAPLIGTFDILWTRLDANSVLWEAINAGKPDIVTALLDKIAAQGRMAEAEINICCQIAASTGDFALFAPLPEARHTPGYRSGCNPREIRHANARDTSGARCRCSSDFGHPDVP